MKTLFTLNIIYLYTTCILGARILGIFPVINYSHHKLGYALLDALSKKGHEVILITRFNELTTRNNFRLLYLNGTNSELSELELIVTTPFAERMSIIKNTLTFTKYNLAQVDFIFQHEKIKDLLRNEAKFDAVIIEQFLNDALKVFCYKFAAACIAFSTMGINHLNYDVVNNPVRLTYYSERETKQRTEITIFDKSFNFVINAFYFLSNRIYAFPLHDALVQKYFPGVPNIYKLMGVDLLLINTNVATSISLPRTPNTIEIGSFHIKVPNKLSEDVENFLNSDPNGFILFTLGSYTRSIDMPLDMIRMFIRVFANLKYKILWKFEDSSLEDMPSNVMTAKWFSQEDILAHPNIKLFITHCGLLSMTEATYYGVPMLALPIDHDQFANAETIQNTGAGLKISLSDLTENKLTNVLQDLLQDKKYKKMAILRSKLMKDQPIKPIDSAIFWIEYSIRYKNLSYFRSNHLESRWYEIILLDVFVLIGGCILMTILILCLMLKYFYRISLHLFVSKKHKRA